MRRLTAEGCRLTSRFRIARLAIVMAVAALVGAPGLLSADGARDGKGAARSPDDAPCPAGQFADAATGYCYSCRPGFWRNPAVSPELSGACYSPARREERAARRYDRTRSGSCSGGQFASGGYCYRCDIGFDRNGSYPPNRRGACYRDRPDREEPAIRHDPVGPTPRPDPEAGR